MKPLTSLLSVLAGLYGACALAQAPADTTIVELYCTGDAWGLGGGQDSVETEAYLRIGSKSIRLEVAGFGAGTLNGPLKAPNAMTRTGTLRLALGADSDRQREVSFSLNRFSGQLTVFPANMQAGDKILFNGTWVGHDH
jgi:hypothetical protein